MSYVNPQSLLATDALAAHLGDPDLRVVDASWHLPDAGRDARAEFTERHIPGAVFFDIDEIADTKSALPHMLPDPVKFSSRMRKLGLGDGNRIVVYDSVGLLSAARVWWMLRYFGHPDVAVLDGGLPKWIAEERPTSSLPDPPRERHFTPRANALMLREFDQMQANVASGREQVLDARAAARFDGSAPEPRPGLRAGHIPGSLNLPFDRLLDPESGTMRPADALRAEFIAAGVDLARPVITTCGSGVTAAILALALDLIGHGDVALYDGSWSEWGSLDDAPVETG